MAIEECRVCGSRNTALFLQRDQVPVHQNLVFAGRPQALAAPRGELRMMVCEDCGFVFNQAFDATLLAYGQDYDNTQSHSPCFDAYLDQLVHNMVTVQGVRNCRIVEVGCGKGHFLRKLVNYPAAGNQGFGFDPSYVGPDNDLEGRLVFSRSFYGAGCADVAADVVVCRHVIEHVPDPAALLDAVRCALVRSPDARVFFETPCVEWILRNRVLWDLFYEHCALFCAASLRLAFERHGFSVESVSHVFGGQYLWLQARPAPCALHGWPARAGAAVASLARAFGADEQSLRQTWLGRLEVLKQQGKIALWGAGAKGVTFANLVDLDGALLDCVVDINPHKQGCFVPGAGHPIVAPASLPQRGVRNVILMNPNYRNENRQLLEAVRCDAQLVDWSEA